MFIVLLSAGSADAMSLQSRACLKARGDILPRKANRTPSRESQPKRHQR